MIEPHMFGPSDELPEFLQCPDDCISKAILALRNHTVRTVTRPVPGQDDETFVNREDVEKAMELFFAVQVKVMEHTPGTTLEMAQPIVLGMQSIATNIRNMMHAKTNLTSAEAPETIPTDWV